MFMQYGVMANYCWLLVEGMYLHSLLGLASAPERSFFTLYLTVGWGEWARGLRGRLPGAPGPQLPPCTPQAPPCCSSSPGRWLSVCSRTSSEYDWTGRQAVWSGMLASGQRRRGRADLVPRDGGACGHSPAPPEALLRSRRGRGRGLGSCRDEPALPAGAGPAMATWASGGSCASRSSWPSW